MCSKNFFSFNIKFLSGILDVKSILNTFEFDITLENMDIYHLKKDLLT